MDGILQGMAFVAQEGPAPGGGAPGWVSFWPIIAMLVILYFLILRPQQKRERERKEMLGGVKTDDRVVTIGGIHGVVRHASEKEIVLCVDDKKDVRIRMARSAVSRIVGADGDAEGGE